MGYVENVALIVFGHRKTLRLAVVAPLLVLVGCSGSRARAVAVPHRECPSTDSAFRPSPDPAARARIVPGKPTGVRVCRYWGADDSRPQFTFAGQRFVAGSDELLRFVGKLNALKPIPTAPLPSCPISGGRSVLLLFRYGDVPDDPVQIVRAGCIPVSNGHLRERYGLGLPLGTHWPDEGAL